MTPAVAIAKACRDSSIAWSVKLPAQRLPAAAALALATISESQQPAEFSRLETPRFFSDAAADCIVEPATGCVLLPEKPWRPCDSIEKRCLAAAVEHATIG